MALFTPILPACEACLDRARRRHFYPSGTTGAVQVPIISGGSYIEQSGNRKDLSAFCTIAGETV
ncbi:MAG: hypothetical protein DSY90_09225 [Deltaproteobacteria bacterium]|nr:MAG: hypothetical protein DSY90_09225 [Deltaproteobacteria bacterium]